MGEWSRTRSVRLTADENNAEVCTRARKTRNKRPATASRTTAARAHSPRNDAPEHVSETRPQSCAHTVTVSMVLCNLSSLHPLPRRSQAVQSAFLQSHAPHWLRLSRLLGASGRPRRLIVLPHNKPCVTEKRRLLPETRLRHFWEGAHASSCSWTHPQITQFNARLLMKSQRMQPS